MSNIIVPATVTLASVAVGNIIPGAGATPYTALGVVRPVSATIIAFGILGAASGAAPKLVNTFAWTIAGTAIVTLALPVVTKYFPYGETK